MLTNDEKLFLKYWEKNREKQRNTIRQILMNAPFGLVFALPILILVLFHGWYKNMIYISESQLIVIIIGVLLVALFFAFIRGKVRFEHNEQLYKELKFKETRDKELH
jgi:hypothetical protein